VVADRHLVGAVAGSEAKDQREVPNAYAYLNAVCIGLPVIGGLGDIHLGLLQGRSHSSYSLQGSDGPGLLRCSSCGDATCVPGVVRTQCGALTR
jgi:hypothetical protein